MRREDRLEAMVLAEEDELVAMADRVLESLDVEVMRGPTIGLLMVRVEEPSDRLPFNFTEVTVSEAEVAAGEHRGYAMVMGKAPHKALAAAVLDAAIEIGHPLTGEITTLLRDATAGEEAVWQQRWSEVVPTMVSFEDATE